MFSSGEIITLVARISDEWLRGELKGKTGLFPAAFIEIIEDLPASEMPGEITPSAFLYYAWSPWDHYALKCFI